MKPSLKLVLRPLLLPWAGLWDPVYIGWVRWRTGYQKPIPPIAIRRRKGGSGADVSWFVKSGRLDAEVFLDAINRHSDRPLAAQTVLDFGAGVGRLLGHFSGRCADLHAVDVDRMQVEYLSRHFPEVHCQLNSEDPPLRLESGSVDTVFSFSVWTHLSFEDQMLWLNELWRVLRPNGLALISIHTESSIDAGMKGSREWQEECAPKLAADGFYFTTYTSDGMATLNQKILAQSTPRYGYTVQTEAQVRRVWGELFNVLEFSELAFRRHQTLVALRKRSG